MSHRAAGRLREDENATLHALLATQCERTPDATAVEAGEEQLSFSELDERANRLAHRLRELGVAPEMRVAICMERSPDLVVAALGVLKAGGAYVPLDPSWPRARLSYIVEDAKARVVLCQERLASAVPANGYDLVAVDREWPEIESHPADPPPDFATSADLACVTYASGSAGRTRRADFTHAAVTEQLGEPAADDSRDGSALLSAHSGPGQAVIETLAPVVSGAGA